MIKCLGIGYGNPDLLVRHPMECQPQCAETSPFARGRQPHRELRKSAAQSPPNSCHRRSPSANTDGRKGPPTSEASAVSDGTCRLILGTPYRRPRSTRSRMASSSRRRTMRPSPSLKIMTWLPGSRPASASRPRGITTRPSSPIVTSTGSRIMRPVCQSGLERSAPERGAWGLLSASLPYIHLWMVRADVDERMAETMRAPAEPELVEYARLPCPASGTAAEPGRHASSSVRRSPSGITCFRWSGGRDRH